MIPEITVYSPATIANLVCGFDVLGLALAEPADKMTIRLLSERTVIVRHTDDFGLPEEAARNCAGAALLAMVEELPANIGFEVVCEKRIKPGSGIGSSAASAAGAVVGANMLLDGKFSNNDLVRFAMSGEEVASGSRHADNIAPCIFGGITLIRSNHPVDIVAIDSPPLYVTVVHPQIEVKTSDARAILKKQIFLKDAVTQWGNVAGLVAGLMKGDYGLIGRSLEDVIVEPVRSILIPGFAELKSRCKAAGALGGGIAGAGPSVFMLSTSAAIAQSVAEAIDSVYGPMGIPYHTYITTISPQGVRVVDDGLC